MEKDNTDEGKTEEEKEPNPSANSNNDQAQFVTNSTYLSGSPSNLHLGVLHKMNNNIPYATCAELLNNRGRMTPKQSHHPTNEGTSDSDLKCMEDMSMVSAGVSSSTKQSSPPTGFGFHQPNYQINSGAGTFRTAGPDVNMGIILNSSNFRNSTPYITPQFYDSMLDPQHYRIPAFKSPYTLDALQVPQGPTSMLSPSQFQPSSTSPSAASTLLNEEYRMNPQSIEQNSLLGANNSVGTTSARKKSSTQKGAGGFDQSSTMPPLSPRNNQFISGEEPSIPQASSAKPKKSRGSSSKSKKLPLTLTQYGGMPPLSDQKPSDRQSEDSLCHLPPAPTTAQPWGNSYLPLGLDEDKYWLSELQCFLRSHVVEVFGAMPRDVAVLRCGRSKPIALGQVGIRCMYCRDVYPVSERGQQAVSYPGLIQGIYNSVQQMLRTHFETCQHIPADVRASVDNLRASSSARGGRKQYWEDAAKRLGLMDTQRGIYFRWNPSEPMPEEYKNSADVGGVYRNGRIVQPKSGKSDEMSPLKPVNIDLSGETKSNTADRQVATSEGSVTTTTDAEGKDLRYYPPPLTTNNPELMEEDNYDLVLPEDEPLISDYLYLALRQMRPCLLNNADLVGCYKDRETGFRGLACKHCIGQAGCGRYFPASEASLSQTTTSHTIFNHVRNCRRVPMDIRNELELMKKGRIGPDGKKIRPKHGGRKVFFNRLWCRIQGLEIVEETPPSSVKEKKKKATESKEKKKKKPSKRKRKPSIVDSEEDEEEEEGEDDDSSHDGGRYSRKKGGTRTRTFSRRPKKNSKFDDFLVQRESDDEDGQETDTESEEVIASKKKAKLPSESPPESKRPTRKSSRNRTRKIYKDSSVSESDHEEEHSKRGNSASPDSDSSEERNNDLSNDDESVAKEASGYDEDSGSSDDEEWFQGRCNLAKPDDPFWLSELQCYIRSNMVEVFSASEEDVKNRGRHIFVGLGNVGVRCIFCANSENPKRHKGHVIYPSSLAHIHQAVTDLHRRHFSSCSLMPKGIRESYKSMRGFTSKEDDETQQYWIDSAKDIGLADSPHGGTIFNRDPALSSHADILNGVQNDEKSSPEKTIMEKTNGLIHTADRRHITDFYLFLFQQVVPCRFREKDRKKGTGIRKDLKAGFPGLQCKFCAGKSHHGRYFPFSQKSLADNTTHSLYTHIQSCSNCPEMVKSSVAYLTHRSILQKNELKRGWKRNLFDKIWTRLHNDSNWNGNNFLYSLEDEEMDVGDSGNENGLNSQSEGGLSGSEADSSMKDEDINSVTQVAQMIIDINEDLLSGNNSDRSDDSSGVDSDALGSDIAEAVKESYPRRSRRRRRKPVLSPVLTRATRRSCSILNRGNDMAPHRSKSKRKRTKAV